MTLTEFAGIVPDFNNLTPRDLICHFAWFLHVHKSKENVGYADVRACFRELYLKEVDVTTYLPQMANKREPDLIRHKGGYRLEGRLRRTLDAKFGQEASVVVITKMLADLPDKLGTVEEREFLTEALKCYRVAAYRSAIVMTWNLAFDHLLRWIVQDAGRLVSFNQAIGTKYPKRSGFQVSQQIETFEEFTEAETIELCRTGRLISKNIIEILREKLKRRNAAAHPSQVVITQMQADDVISDLVNNVILSLT
jgi:hypothetical protein